MNRQTFSQTDIASFHWVKFNGQQGEILYTLTGIILVDLKGSSQNWMGLNITCKIDIPELPAGEGLYIRYHAPSASLNSIFNERQANNGGHSVNTCRLDNIHPDGNFGTRQITLALGLAVRDSDAWLHRVGFNITLTGVLRPLLPVDPCKDEAEKLQQLQNLCDGGYESQIAIAQAQLQHASPAQKPAIIRLIRRLQESLGNCPVDLQTAQAALNRCKITQGDLPNEITP